MGPGAARGRRTLSRRGANATTRGRPLVSVRAQVAERAPRDRARCARCTASAGGSSACLTRRSARGSGSDSWASAPRWRSPRGNSARGRASDGPSPSPRWRGSSSPSTRRSEWAAIADEPTATIEAARTAFLERDKARTASELRKATAFVHLEETRAAGAAKRGLAEAARDLSALTREVEADRIERIDQFDARLARAEHALAVHYHERAQHHYARNAVRATGHYLRASARALPHAAAWPGHEAVQITRVVVGDVIRVSGKLVEGIGWVPEEIGSLIERLGAGIDRVGQQVHGKREAK